MDSTLALMKSKQSELRKIQSDIRKLESDIRKKKSTILRTKLQHSSKTISEKPRQAQSKTCYTLYNQQHADILNSHQIQIQQLYNQVQKCQKESNFAKAELRRISVENEQLVEKLEKNKESFANITTIMQKNKNEINATANEIIQANAKKSQLQKIPPKKLYTDPLQSPEAKSIINKMSTMRQEISQIDKETIKLYERIRIAQFEFDAYKNPNWNEEEEAIIEEFGRINTDEDPNNHLLTKECRETERQIRVVSSEVDQIHQKTMIFEKRFSILQQISKDKLSLHGISDDLPDIDVLISRFKKSKRRKEERFTSTDLADIKRANAELENQLLQVQDKLQLQKKKLNNDIKILQKKIETKKEQSFDQESKMVEKLKEKYRQLKIKETRK